MDSVYILSIRRMARAAAAGQVRTGSETMSDDIVKISANLPKDTIDQLK